MDSTVTVYWSGLKVVPSTSKDQVFAVSPCWMVTVPASLEKPEVSPAAPGWNAAEATSTISSPPAARLVVPVIVNVLPADWARIGSIRIQAFSRMKGSFVYLSSDFGEVRALICAFSAAEAVSCVRSTLPADPASGKPGPIRYRPSGPPVPTA